MATKVFSIVVYFIGLSSALSGQEIAESIKDTVPPALDTSISVTELLEEWPQDQQSELDSFNALSSSSKNLGIFHLTKQGITYPYRMVAKGYHHVVNQYPDPKTAAYFGLFFPAGGQLYNKDWWKVPIVWGAYGYVVYLINQNQSNYRLLREAVLDRINGRPDPFPGFSLPGLRQQRDLFRKNLERAWIGLVAVHLLSSLEAFVACHLRLFDITDELSIHLLRETNPQAISSHIQANTFSFISISYCITCSP